MDTKRLYIFTGKGGVGKTTISLAFTSLLQQKGLKARLIYFKNSKLDENSESYQEVKVKAASLNVECIGLDLLDSAKNYIAQKLGSITIAGWVVKTPFFKSLINMIPGFNYLIYMGQMLQYLKEDPNLILVLDSPSSGHALTMFEATKNFNQIFQSGTLFEDTQEMLELLAQKDFIQINILTLPTLLALQETQELELKLSQIESFKTRVICNYSLEGFRELNLPKTLRHKLENELTARQTSGVDLSFHIPFCLADDLLNLNKELLPSMENLV